MARPPLPSLDTLSATLMSEREKQLTHFESLDTKAGILLAFDGVLITLTRDITLAFQIPSVVLALASAVLALVAFWPRDYPVFEPTALRKYMTYPDDQTRLKLHDVMERMVAEGAGLLKRKARNLKPALILLALAAITFGAGIVITNATGEVSDASPGSGPRAVTPTPAAPAT